MTSSFDPNRSASLGSRIDPYLGVNFLVEIEGLVVGGFTTIDGLESSIATEDYHEGGRNDYVHKILKGTTYAPLVLSRGVTDAAALWTWHDRVRRGVVRRKNGTIMLLDTQRVTVMWWNFADAVPIKWVGPSFNAASDGHVAIEKLELAHRGITRHVQASSTASTVDRSGGAP